MTDEAAESRGPATTGEAAPSPGATAPSPPAAATSGAEATTAETPPPHATAAGTPPDAGGSPGGHGGAPPEGGTGRRGPRYNLVRPRQGRYAAGVCAAIGRATNTDPVLWRVLIAVLGFFGGIGILVYVAAWLIIPAEGDTASPVEALLGRGRSSMSPVTVLILGVGVAVMFGYIVTDVFRAVLLGAAILIAGALLLNRNSTVAAAAAGPGPQPFGAAPPRTGTPADDLPAAAAPGPPAGTGAPRPYPPIVPTATRADAAAGPVTAPVTAAFPPATPAAGTTATTTLPLADPPPPPVPQHAAPAAPQYGAPYGPPPGPSTGGYRPPFAPHGPFAGAVAPAGPPQPPPRPPKPPRERSKLGAATFWLLFVALGLVAIADLTDAVPVWPSTYFAAALVTVAFGLLVGAWFGRARWLIVLGVVASLGLGLSTATESWNGVRATGDVVWAPATMADLADRYETGAGDATLDLSRLDFAGQDSQVTVAVKIGSVRVVLPPKVDVNTQVQMKLGDAQVLGQTWEGVNQGAREITDRGADGPGGGALRLNILLDVGDVEVKR